MGKKMKAAISPLRSENYPEWYQQVVKASDMAESSPVRGCMVIKPWGYALWENITRILDDIFKDIGVKNAYFPIFIPLSFLEKEAEHVDGFAKECAVVTHHKLEKNDEGNLVPAGKLTEPIVVRPTSEMIIGDSFRKWISSYRDLPLLINQWGNVVRWEMRTRIFLRTSEFLWNEGHTAHETKEDALDLTVKIIDIYDEFLETYLAMPVIKGVKSASERFPGADETYCIESMMYDRKALQAGTSHFLGQNFSKGLDIKFQSRDEKEEFVWTTSWAVSTRLLGGAIMTHGDDDGMVMPPRIAPSHVVLIPIIRNESDYDSVMEYTENLAKELRKIRYYERKLVVEIDKRDIGGTRGWDWIKKGIPVRVEIGPRDIANDSVFVARRDKAHNDKTSIKRDEFIKTLPDIMDDMHENLLKRVLDYREENSRKIDEKDEFYAYYTPVNKDNPEIHGGFAFSHWCGSEECEESIKKDLSVTIRCIPLDNEKEAGRCIYCGNTSKERVVFAKSY